jgi:hypothetical protein
VLCGYLLRRPVEPADDQAVAEVLLEDLVASQPLLLPYSEDQRAIGFQHDEDAGRPPNGSHRPTDQPDTN